MSRNPESQSATSPAADEVHDLSSEFDDELHEGQSPQIEEFLARRQHCDVAALLKELLAVEVEFRQSRSEKPAVRDYRGRFPEHADLIDEFSLL